MKIGFIGLGNMGSGMVSNLLKGTDTISIYDIEKEKLTSAEKNGAMQMSPQDMAKKMDVIILCLPHPRISESVLDNILLHKSNVTTIIDTSTLTPDDSLDSYKKCKSDGVQFLCAPMLGGQNHAKNRLIHFLVEGDQSVFQDVEPIFFQIGARTDYIGAIPSATVAKLAYNICRYSNLATAVEVSRLLRSYITDTQPIYDLLTEGSLDNFGQVWAEDIKEMVIEGKNYVPGNIPDKDLTLVIELQKNNKLSTIFVSAVKDVYKSLVK